MNKFQILITLCLTLILSVSVISCTEQYSEPKSLDEVLADQDDWLKERFDARHPKETLEFFGIQPGMTVVDVLPSSGWYSRILLPYLGRNGQYIGADYSVDTYALIGFPEERLKDKICVI